MALEREQPDRNVLFHRAKYRPLAASTEGPSLSTLGSHAQDVEYVPDDTQAPWAAGTGGAFDLPAKWRKLAEASEDKYNHNPDCVNEDFEPLRMCADELEAALAAQAEVRAAERALAQRIIDLPCIVEVRGPDVVGQIAEQLATRPDVAGGGRKAYRCWFDCPTCKQEHEVQWETYEKPDFSCQNAVTAESDPAQQKMK